MKRRLYLAGIFGLALTAGGFLANLGKRSEPVQQAQQTLDTGKEIIIPGTWLYDIDSMKLPGEKRSFWRDLLDLISSADVRRSFSPFRLEYGANSAGCDVWLEHFYQNKRTLVPKNGAQLTRLGIVDFDNVTLEDLMSVQYSVNSISLDGNNQLLPGEIIAIRTNEGKYAKLRFDEWLPLIHRKKIQKQNDIRDYHLQGTLVVYENN